MEKKKDSKDKKDVEMEEKKEEEVKEEKFDPYLGKHTQQILKILWDYTGADD